MDFFGYGKEGSIPVYAVADGLLTRRPGWVDAVAILHENPLRPTKKVWTSYSGMADDNGSESYVLADFPAGITNIPVKSDRFSVIRDRGVESHFGTGGCMHHLRWSKHRERICFQKK